MTILSPPASEQVHRSQAMALPGARKLDLRFALDGDRTRMFVHTQQPPWRAIRAFENSGRQAVVHLHNVSGGILSGDALELSVEAGPGARAQVTSVGAARIYRRREGRSDATQFTSIRVRDGAHVEYVPDAAIPFAGSRFRQSTEVSLGANAGFIGWDILSAGRIAGGEEFAFASFRSELRIRSAGRLIALERYCLAPPERDPRSTARWGRFRYTASMYICQTGVAPAVWPGLETRLNRLAFEVTSAEARWGVSSLVADGLIVRGMAMQAHQIAAGLLNFWEQAKREIRQEKAIPPRKIN